MAGFARDAGPIITDLSSKYQDITPREAERKLKELSGLLLNTNIQLSDILANSPKDSPPLSNTGSTEQLIPASPGQSPRLPRRLPPVSDLHNTLQHSSADPRDAGVPIAWNKPQERP